MSLTHVLCVPQLSFNLISVRQLASFGYLVTFFSTGCSEKDCLIEKQNRTGSRKGDLYYFCSLHLPSSSSSSAALVTSMATFVLWHSHLGHLPLNQMELLLSSGCFGNIFVSDIFHYFGCRLGKQHLLPYNKSSSVTHYSCGEKKYNSCLHFMIGS